MLSVKLCGGCDGDVQMLSADYLSVDVSKDIETKSLVRRAARKLGILTRDDNPAPTVRIVSQPHFGVAALYVNGSDLVREKTGAAALIHALIEKLTGKLTAIDMLPDNIARRDLPASEDEYVRMVNGAEIASLRAKRNALVAEAEELAKRIAELER